SANGDHRSTDSAYLFVLIEELESKQTLPNLSEALQGVNDTQAYKRPEQGTAHEGLADRGWKGVMGESRGKARYFVSVCDNSRQFSNLTDFPGKLRRNQERFSMIRA